jgi:formate dehydrogenase beta subunit
MELGEADASGRRRPVDTGEEVTEGVDLVVAAVGQHPKKFEGFGVETDKKGRIIVRADSMLTSRPKVYAGGDAVLGPSTLIESIAQGRVAAGAMDKLLGGDGDIEEKLLPDGWETDPRIGRDEGFNKIRKFHPIMLAPEKRANWDEVELGFDDATARAEARAASSATWHRPSSMRAAARVLAGPDAATVAGVTTESGVYQLLDGDKKVLAIKGVENLREGLEAMLDKAEIAPYFTV